MRAYYMDDVEGDQRASHDSGVSVGAEDLRGLGVLSYHFDTMDQVDQLAKDRSYVNRDTVLITPEGLGGPEKYAEKLKIFFAEHLHEDEEIRYILDGDGYFDVRDKSDAKWIRIHVEKGDLIILPAGIYHRFTLSSNDYIKALRLFQNEPKWVAHNRPEADDNEYRLEYKKTISV